MRTSINDFISKLTNLVFLKILLFFLLTYFFSQALMAFDGNALSPTEITISQYVDHNEQQALLLLEKLVNINSGTANISGVKKVGKILQAEFNKIGFHSRWVSEPANMRRAPTLILEKSGTSGKRILLIGHLDTVFPSSSSFKKFKRHGNIASGPGVVDCKGGDVVILYALKALNTAHVLKDATITIVLTGDEEDSGKPTSISRKPLFAAAKQSDLALDFELASSIDTAAVARRGITNWQLTTQGKESHSANIFHKDEGAGAVFELARILNTMRTQLEHEEHLAFNPGIILGGTTIQYDKNNYQGIAKGKSNIVARIAMVKGDLRFLAEEQKQQTILKINKIVNDHLPVTQAKIFFEDGIPSMPVTSGNLKLLNEYGKVNEDLGYGTIKALGPDARGAGDISFIASMMSGNLAGLGPVGSGAHSEQEIMEIKSLPIQTKKAAILIYRLTR